ncbi:hypothetical protein SAMN05216421_1791 [Halopseudomonas xinjiangensis]|uniref:Uncharacterized protein n=1 Tax=Halopseudomonas xinjiangensis TaxID=487184 RepID=A0A1H1TE76_9GAMM|nr:hypothetical protein [Halopseudomonas xinjiangensis]SDS58444.1 hypothetical protein SAMN05216421_1791 [Halopseudomonas xinjiangensis]
MNLLRTLGLCFLFVMVPLGGLLAAYPDEIANGLSSLMGVEVTRGNLGVAFLGLAAVCMRVDLSIRRRAQARLLATT